MKALVYKGAGKKAVVEKEKPVIQKPTDVVVKMLKSAICGTDLHILKGAVPEVPKGCTLGHEGIGIVEQVGKKIKNFKIGDKVILSCVTSCGKCENCKKGMFSHCVNGGWIFGHLIDGVQAEYVRVPYGDTSMYHIPKGVSDDEAVLLSDVLPTGYEIGVLNGAVKKGDVIAIVGMGPIGLSALIGCKMFKPSKIIAIDLDDNRLKVAKELGATHILNSSNKNLVQQILQITKGKGVDVSMEAVGFPETFNICQKIIAKGGHIANLGVHGKSVELDLQKLWIMNVNISTGLVDTRTTPDLIKLVANKKLKASKLITHHCNFKDILQAYEIFANAKETKAIKLILDYDL